MGLLQLILTVIYKERAEKLLETLSDVGLFFNKMVVDWFFVEALAIVILFYITFYFRRYIGLSHPGSFREIMRINLRYLPILLIALLIFIPLAIFLRHVWRNDFAIEGQRLMRLFRHFGRMYREALLPFMVVGYVFFNGNLYLQSGTRKGSGKKDRDQPQGTDFLEVINDNGNSMIATSKILWIEKKDRTYEVKTEEKLFYVRKTLNELEAFLADQGFIRINRSVLVNRTFVHNYSFWEYDKFILRMKDSSLTEFIVSRERMRQIKNQLAPST